MSDTRCDAPNCPVKGVEISISEIKRQQERFTEKQDAILLILSEQKAMTVEIHNLKQGLEEFKDNIKSALEDNKDTHIDIYKKINELEQNKSDKSESNKIASWVWGILFLALSAGLSYIMGRIALIK